MASTETCQNMDWFYENLKIIKIMLHIVEMCRQITDQHLNMFNAVLMVNED